MKIMTKYKGLSHAIYSKVSQKMGQFLIAWGCPTHCKTSSPLLPYELKVSWTPNYWNTQQRPRNSKPPKLLLGKCDISFPIKNHSSIVSRCLEQNLDVTSLTSWWEWGTYKIFCEEYRKIKGLDPEHNFVLFSVTKCNYQRSESESCSVTSNSLGPHGLYYIQGILKTRTLEWLGVPFSRGSSQPKDRTQVSRIVGRFFTSWATREAPKYWSG